MELRALGVESLWLDTGAFPETLPLAERNGVVSGAVDIACQPNAVYLRGLACHPLMPGGDAELAVRPRGYIAQCEEKRAFLESLIETWRASGSRIVNTLEANAQHSRKPYQLHLLRYAGLPIPDTLVTNSPDAVRRFAAEHERVVYKPLSGGATVRYLERDDLEDDRLAALAAAPVLFQKYAPGVAVRAFVVGEEVVAAAEIHSSELDYRRGEESVAATTLSSAEHEAALTAARACGMTFTGVDFLRDGARFVVLECNPSPMFAVFEQKTSQNVAAPLARFLAK